MRGSRANRAANRRRVFSLNAAGVTARCAALLALLSSCATPLTDVECNDLLNRYTEMLVTQQQRRATPRELEHAKINARTSAENDPRYEFVACSQRVRRSQFECAMQAPDVDALERCLTL